MLPICNILIKIISSSNENTWLREYTLVLKKLRLRTPCSPSVCGFAAKNRVKTRFLKCCFHKHKFVIFNIASASSAHHE